MLISCVCVCVCVRERERERESMGVVELIYVVFVFRVAGIS